MFISPLCDIFSSSISEAKKSFYLVFNAVFVKIGRATSELVAIEFIKTKCLPMFIYGLEVCLLNKAQ